MVCPEIYKGKGHVEWGSIYQPTFAHLTRAIVFFFLLFFLMNLASTKEDEGHENIDKILYNLIIKSDTTGVY